LEWELLRSVLFAVIVVVGGYFTVFASGSLWPSSLNDDEALNLCLLYPLEYPAVACLTALVAWWGMTNAWGPWTAFLSHPLMYVLASLSYTGYLVQVLTYTALTLGDERLSSTEAMLTLGVCCALGYYVISSAPSVCVCAV
jgi:hypothetical protein